MTADTTPSVALELPPPPEPRGDIRLPGAPGLACDGFDADQMRAYAQRAVEAATRERDAAFERVEFHVAFTRDAQELCSAAQSEAAALRAELASVLDDWNALVQAIGSPTNGGAVGHAAALRRELEALKQQSAIARVRIDSGEVHIVPAERAAEFSPLADGQMLYAQPVPSAGPAREGLSPLTEERIVEVMLAASLHDHSTAGWVRRQRIAWVRAIEAAHGIAAPAGISEGKKA